MPSTVRNPTSNIRVERRPAAPAHGWGKKPSRPVAPEPGKNSPPAGFFLSHLQKPSQNRNILAESSKSSLPRLSRRPGVGGLGDTRYLESCLHRNDTLPPSIRLRCYPKSKPERAIRQIKKRGFGSFFLKGDGDFPGFLNHSLEKIAGSNHTGKQQNVGNAVNFFRSPGNYPSKE
jgi:hypothetical protein